MELSQFIIHLLRAQANTLSRLAAFFGEDELIEMLEASGDDEAREEQEFDLLPFLETANTQTSGPHSVSIPAAYQRLEGSVREFNLPALLEFHLWAYPFYRRLIESPAELDSRIRMTEPNGLEALIAESISRASAWTKRLPIPPATGLAAEQAAQVPWLRFRAEVLKGAGKRPLGAIPG